MCFKVFGSRQCFGLPFSTIYRHIQNPSSGIELTIKNSSKQKKSKKTARSSPSKKKKNKKSRPDALPNVKSNRSVSQNLRRDRLSAVHKKRQTLEMKNINVFETSLYNISWQFENLLHLNRN